MFKFVCIEQCNDPVLNMRLLLFFLFYFATTFVWPSWRVWRQTGHNPVVLPKDDSAYGFVGQIFRLLIALISAFAAARAFWPEGLAMALPPFAFFDTPAWQRAGWGLLVASWLIIVIAQHGMRQSWRVGIDHARPAGLVQNGLFGLSRNPIFLGMLLTLAGLFFAFPQALTLLIWAVGWVVLSVQIRLEEEFLEKQYGDDYRAYRQRVRRWI